MLDDIKFYIPPTDAAVTTTKSILTHTLILIRFCVDASTTVFTGLVGSTEIQICERERRGKQKLEAIKLDKKKLFQALMRQETPQ